MIKEIDYNNNAFSAVVGNKLMYFYLTNRLSKIFMPHINESCIVDFVITRRVKKIGQKKYHQIKHFNYIEDYKRNFVLYDHEKLKSDMITFLENQKNFLFLDLEMTMPNYNQRKFIPEIIQYGYYLVNSDGKILETGSDYLKTKLTKKLNKHTVRFLNLDVGNYNKNKKDFIEFYNKIKNLMNQYDLKIVVWGKNDIQAIDYAYKIYNLEPITNSNNFIDLLKLHKDYFNLSNDLGLFKAYETYYNKSIHQHHDAKDDAKITKKVFDAFIMYSNGKERGNI